MTCRDSPNGELVRTLSPSLPRQEEASRQESVEQHVKFLVSETGCGSEKGQIKLGLLIHEKVFIQVVNLSIFRSFPLP